MSNCLCGIVLVGTCALSALAGGETSSGPDIPELRIAGAELRRYWCAIVGDGKVPPVRLTVDKTLSKSGNDAYAIKSVDGGAVVIGSNGRSVLYGVYDLLERRGGCGWFWDGDRVPKKDRIDLSGLDVREESKFTYRGIRYFAHRGLMRFQAEHWGPEEWKREIDWCLKKRLNLFMLRIGQDDIFQKTFPDAAKYPDPSKSLPGALKGYDNRTLFWPLEYRGKLRKEIMDYAFARGMMAPEDFGSMTHWYSRTPQDFLDTMKPDFFPQKGGAYSEPSGLIFDIRQKKYRDWYWKLTETSIREYGRPDLLHTIGVAERRVSDDPKVNRQTKIDFTRLIMDEARGHCPQSKILLAGWDFYATWQKDEVPAFLKELDPNRTIIWDYEADAYSNTNFTEWDVIGKFPYTFGIFMAYEAGLDMRTDYDRIVARQKLIESDPMCKGYLLWPESSHVDSIGLEWFAKNSWRADRTQVEPVVDDYCRRRYPGDAMFMRELWMKTLPISTNMQHIWRWNAFLPILRDMGEGLIKPERRKNWPDPKDDAAFADLPKVVAALKALDWEKDELLRRDMVDIARVWADRLAVEAENRMIAAYYRWMDGNDASAEAVVRNGTLAIARLNALAELLALHEDFSICDTYDRLNVIHPIAYPKFLSVLVDNAANSYCASHQAELARHCYIPAFERYLEMLKEKLRKGDRTPFARFCLEDFRVRAMGLDRKSLQLNVTRTRVAFNRALDRILAAAAPSARETVGRDRLFLKDKDGELWWKDRHEAKLKEIADGPKAYDLVMIGDSITDFWETRPSNGWEMVTNSWKALNLGFRGDRVQNVIWRLEHGELDGFKAKTVTLMIGTNNHAWRLELSDPSDTVRAIERIIHLIRERQPEARIVLFGIFPRGTSAKDAILVEGQRRNVDANGLLRRVATETAAEWVDLTERYLDPQTGFCRPELFRDGTHPSRAGYEIWRAALDRVMTPREMTSPPETPLSEGASSFSHSTAVCTNDLKKQIAEESWVVGDKVALAQKLTEAKVWTSSDGTSLPYRLHVPATPEVGRTYPLVIHLHGAGSRGNDNAKQLNAGGSDFLSWMTRRGEECVFLAPQCPAGEKWVDVVWGTREHQMKEEPTAHLRKAMEIIADAMARYPVDRNRVYVMGISMGGYATWELLQRHPDWFAAALPCCGGGDITLAERMKDVAIWVFHGEKDPVVPVYRAQSMVEALKGVGGNVTYREYPETGHNAWTPTFTDDAVFDWLWTQRRGLADSVGAVVRRQMDEGLIAGAVVASGTCAPTAFGDQCRVARQAVMTPTSRFDIASVTKTFVAVLCARLAAQGKLDVDAPFTNYLPDHVLAKGDCAITVRDLAMHVGGFGYEKTVYQKTGDPVEYRRLAMSCRPKWARQECFKYSCLNYIYLGWIAEKVTGMTLDRAVKTYVLDPLGMKATVWGPVSDDGTVVEIPCAPEGVQIGQISDNGARAVSPHAVGNAGLFSTAGDLRLYMQDLLARKTFEPAAYDLLFTCAYEKNGARRSFGFDMCADKRPRGLSDKTIYHSGWSGQTIAIDPDSEFCGVCLTARAGDHVACIKGRMEILSLMSKWQ